MRWLASVVTRPTYALAIVLAVASLAILSLVGAANLQQDEDILAFLPQENPDVRLFYDINKRFGSTDVALVGVEVDDPFTAEFLTKLRAVTDKLEELPPLDHVLSLGNVIDFTPDKDAGGIITAPLIDAVPTSPQESSNLREKVMSRDHVVGNLISQDGKAVLIYCYLGYGTNPKVVSAEIREAVEEHLSGYELYWGGGPFISTYVYTTTQEDLRKLTPWAVLAIVVIMMLVFRDLVGTSVALLSTAIGIVLSLGVMAWAGVAFNIMLSSTPVVLFAIGSAYGLHVLSHYYANQQHMPGPHALRKTLVEAGPVVLTAGFTTAASLVSFAAMDIQPVRIFGVFTSLGILITLILSVTFVPSLISLFRLKGKVGSSGPVPVLTSKLARFGRRRRVPVAATLTAVAIAFGLLVSKVDTGVDMTTFFSAGSPPDQAASFMREHFGGSQFVQVHAKGDMNDPLTLRRLRAVADRISQLPNVSSVLHIGDAVAQSNSAMVGQLRIPDTSDQLRLLYTFVGTDPSIGQLVTRDRKQALIHVKVATEKSDEVNRVIEDIEAVTAEMGGTWRVAELRADQAAGSAVRQMLAWRLAALSQAYGARIDNPQGLQQALEQEPPRVDRIKIAAEILGFLRSSECAVSVEEMGGDDVAKSIAAGVAALGPAPTEEQIAQRVAQVLEQEPTEPLVEDLTYSMAMPVSEAWAKAEAAGLATQVLAAAEITPPPGNKGERFRNAVSVALLDLGAPTAAVPATGDIAQGSTGALALQANGLPVMHRGLSHSVTRNQVLSLACALGLVLLIMSVVFRSVVSGLLATTPTMFTVVVVYGGMGGLGVHLDLGTSMLASIIMGAGVDYAVHLMSAWRAPLAGAPQPDLVAAAERAARTTGTAIWTNAVMIGAGFLVLTMGEAKPLQNVGSLTAAAMLVAATATFLLVPALAHRAAYSRVAPVEEEILDVLPEHAKASGSKES